MTDLVPVITSTTSVPETPTPAVIFTPVERIVRLGDLGIARENLRYGEPPDDDIPTLAATLKAAGQLQPVTVRPGRGKKEQPFMALDGRRRRLALASLLEAGDIDEDYPVRTYVETDPARQAAAVLLTNTAVPVHVADVIAAIGRMLKSKLTITAMARALGYDEIEIKRLAALSGVAPAALVALKAGRITLRQTRLLARLPDLQEQKDIAQMTLDGQGFQEWRVKERLDDSRVTTRDRRCALVDPQAYADAGGRTESDLFGELPPVLLDPDILTEVWTRRARGIAAVFEAEGISVHVTAGPEPELPDDLEALGYVYGGSLPAEEMARYRAQREVFNDRTEKARIALADVEHPDVADLAIVDMIHAKIASDQTGCGGRVVTTMVLWPAAEAGVEVRCYTPEEPEIDEEDQDAAPEAARRTAAPPAYVPPEVEAPEPETEGVNHALHAVRTDVATR
ncbi:MAG TPA: chromosome partitioning protein ParB, partial [Brevundimonas sp.]|nr:chromosome partitioning protein ParB [Brevundimonas sp.]